MQFTISIVAASLLAASNAAPFAPRSQVCSVAPSATGSQDPISTPTAATADACEKLCEADSSCLSFVFGLPPSASAPLCRLYAVPAAQVPTQETDLVVFDKACADIPTTAPTTSNPVGVYSGSGSDPSSSQNTQHQKRNICDAVPTGPSTEAQSPLQTKSDIGDLAACLALCKTTSGCESVEFGKPAVNGQNQCLLFDVPAAKVPAPTDGQTFVASDIGC